MNYNIANRLTSVRGLDIGITVGMLRDLENLGLIKEVETGRWMRIQRAGQNGHGMLPIYFNVIFNRGNHLCNCSVTNYYWILSNQIIDVNKYIQYYACSTFEMCDWFLSTSVSN